MWCNHNGNRLSLDSPTFRHLTFQHPDILTPRHFDDKTFCHPLIKKEIKKERKKERKKKRMKDIVLPRHFATKTLSYFTIHPNSCDLGTAHARMAFGQFRT